MRVLFFALILVGCDGATLRTSDGTGEVQSKQAQLQFSAAGVGSLFEATTPEGLIVKKDVVLTLLNDSPYQIGPLDEMFSISTQATTLQEDVISILFDLDTFSFPLAVRSDENGTTICRYKVSGDSVEIRTDVEVGNQDGLPRLSVLDFVTPILNGFTISEVGICDLNIDISMLRTSVDDYLTAALVSAATEIFETSPTRLLGLPVGATAIEKESGGRLIIEQLLTANGAKIDSGNVSIALDLGVSANRDPCVPPVEYISQAVLSSQGIEQLTDDIGFSFSKTFLKDVFASSVLAGLFCWEGVPVVLNQTKLDEIGLDFLRLSSSMDVKFQPASLPQLSFEQTGVVRINWPLFTLDTHAEVFGASQRIVLVTGSLDLRLSPRVTESGVIFEIESLSVATSEVKTKWSNEALASPALDQWVQRLILLSFRDRLVIPSPLRPEVDLSLDGLTTTETDVVLLYSVD